MTMEPNLSPLRARRSIDSQEAFVHHAETKLRPLIAPLEFLRELVNIDSTTADIAGVRRVQRSLSAKLDQLGFNVRMIQNPDQQVASAELLCAELQGECPEYITFVTHADTVLFLSQTGEFRVDGDLAYGSGIIDNKGGSVVALSGIEAYLQSLNDRKPHYSLRFVSSPNEEAGSLGFHEIFRNFADDSWLVLGFEPALEDGSIIESRRGNRWYQLHIQGQEAHAGRCRGEQMNAAHDLAAKIVQLAALNNPAAGIAVNIGHIEAGVDRFNVVCGFASAKIDTRFPSFEARENLHREIHAILTTPQVTSPVTGKTTSSRYEIADDCPPFSSTEATEHLVQAYLECIQKIEGRSVRAERAGGAGDVNYMSRPDTLVFDGLGAMGAGMHTPNECVFISSLETRAQVLAAFLERVRHPSASCFPINA